MQNILATTLLLACSSGTAPTPPEDDVVEVESGDPKMNAAMDEARQTLPVFWKDYDANEGQRDNHSLKVKLPTAGGSFEHIWVDHIVKGEPKHTAKLANDPADLGGLKFGDDVSFGDDQVSDWSITIGGLMYGHFTTRVTVTRLPADQAAGIVPLLSKEPLPK